jgi:hypothetical protein
MNSRHVRTVLVVVVLVVVLGTALGDPLRVVEPDEERPRRSVDDVKIVTVDPDSEATLWPFTSRAKRFETLTLPINVVVRGNAYRVRRLLTTGADASWNSSAGEWRGVGDERGGVVRGEGDWYEAHGSTRYTYVNAPNGGWVDEAYQLHVGDYFGSRYHVRAYAGGSRERNSSWTAMQAHSEYWDWFRLRHTVGSTALGRRYVESEFRGRPAVESISRARFANGGISDADGWSTVVVLTDPSDELPSPSAESATVAGLLAVVALSTSRGRAVLVEVRDHADRRLIPFVAAVAFLPALRWAALAVERAAPALSPKLVAAPGYLLLVFALPACAVAAGRTEVTLRGSLLAACVAVGMVVDYARIGVTVVPLAAVGHRVALLTVLGAIAASDTDRVREYLGERRRVLALGVLWAGVLAWPLFDLL